MSANKLTAPNRSTKCSLLLAGQWCSRDRVLIEDKLDGGPGLKIRRSPARPLSRSTAARAHVHSRAVSLRRRELLEIVNSDRLFELGDALHHLLESIFTEQMMLLFLEVFRHGIVFVR